MLQPASVMPDIGLFVLLRSPIPAADAQNSLLRRFHPARATRRSIVESVQMQETMHNVQFQLPHQRVAECTGVPARRLDTDEDFSVLKREHVSGPCLSHKFPMQKGHAPIGNEPDKNLGQVAQLGSFLFPQVETMFYSVTCELFEFSDVNRNLSLSIPHADARRVCASVHLLRDIFLLLCSNQDRAIMSSDI
jgi:hypothetical protein